MTMLVLSDLQKLPLALRFLKHASANLDAAIKLTSSLVRNDAADATFADGMVTMSLAFHSVELFLKGAILSVQPNESFKGEGHDIEQLERRYRNVFPSKAFRFEVPFSRQAAQLVDPDPDLERAIAEELDDLRKRMPADQMLRYPADRRGVAWEHVSPIAFGYHAGMFLLTLNRLRDDYVRVEALLLQTTGSP